MKSAIRVILPHPFLTLLMIVAWCLLTSSISLGNLLLALVLGILIPQLTYAYWPDAPRGVRVLKLIPYVLMVIWDILIANVAVAWIVLTKSNRAMRSMWVTIPLDLRTPEAITILAGTITLTPGTVSADLSDEGHALLVHALDAESPEAVREEIKSRYERRLKEIFE
ncbi:Na+/H+ antiporter subunit E [Roseivivax isoporae]|uniref:Cation:proton antiporter n=1 Tax=Roseivivax isoporae LMG 25204 TaxID=1449351 RepID=X7F3A6_9RHOB|nr:Na+/H+ antiporter subunit E [Roseivivax isoporae]ETX27402.1 cation:proton antiporter [Roseivivax isoporae LMG 25204]